VKSLGSFLIKNYVGEKIFEALKRRFFHDYRKKSGVDPIASIVSFIGKVPK